jgi:hypothetical protein
MLIPMQDMILPPCILTTVAQLIIFIAVLFFDHNVHAWEKSLDTATRATTVYLPVMNV